jgi:transcriptional regulator with XRE-family HTH domain
MSYWDICVILTYPNGIYNNISKNYEVNTMGIDYISIGNRIKEIRTAKGWTQAKLAEESGVEPSNISHIERAATKLSLPTLVNIANALGVTLDEIAYGSLVKSSHVSIKMIDEILADCSPDELKSIAEVIRTTKSVLKNK